MAALTDALGLVTSGTGTAVFLVGAPGVGKTAILQATQRQALAQGFRVVAAGASQMEAGLAFGLVGQIALALGGDTLTEPARLESQSALLSRILRQFTAFALEQPLLLSLDDLHWADPDSLEFLGFMCRRIGGFQILVLGALRPEPNNAATMARDLVGTGLADALSLKPLSRESASALLTRSVRRSLSDSEIDRIWEACGGSPLLLKTAARTLDDGGSVPASNAAFGTSLLLERFIGIGEIAQRYVESAAILGVRFQPDLAARLSGLDEKVTATVHSALVRSQLLVDLGGGWAAFVHPLFAQALVDAQPLTQRERTHATAFRLLLDQNAPAALAAGHAVAAGLVHDPLAIEVTARAGREALARGALRAASAHLKNAVEMAGQEADPDLLVDHAAALAAGQEIERAEQVCVDLLGRTDLASNLRLGALVLRARVAMIPGRPHELEQRYEAAAAAAAELNPEMETAVLAEAAVTCAVTSPVDWALVATRRALGRTRGVGPTRGALEQLEACALLSQGDPTAISLLAAEAPRWSARAARDPGWGWAMAGHAVNALKMLEDLDGLTRLFEREFERALQDGAPILARLLAVAYADVLYRRGRPLEALGLVQQTTPPEDWPMSPWSRVAIAVLLNELDRRDEAQTHVDGLRGFLEPHSPSYYGQVWLWLDLVDARLRLAAGHAYEASDVLVHAAEVARISGWRHPCIVPWAAVGIEAHLAAGRPDRASGLVEELDEISRRQSVRWPKAVATLGRAQLHASEGRRASADNLFADALKRFADWGMPIDHAEALISYGRYLRRAGRMREAREPLTQAVRLVESTQSLRLVKIARAELAAAGGRRRRRLDDPFKLTSQEERVADLAGEGMTNAQIAGLLHLSPKTVGHHLEHIYAKLRISSRRELIRRHAHTPDR